MLVITIIMLLLVGLGVVFLKILKDAANSLIQPVDTKVLCAQHTWTEYNIGDENALVCTTCGYISNKNFMLSPRGLETFNVIQKQKSELKKTAEMIAELKEDYFNNYAIGKNLNPEEIKALREGFDLYADFVSVLPILIKLKRTQDLVQGIVDTSKRA